jgi:hypothetical protein
LAYATPVLALSQLMEHAAAKMVESAKALRREIVAAQTATVARRLIIVVPAARTLSGYAAAVRAPSQLMETAPRTGRPARARPLEIAVVLPITAARRPLIAALGGKWTLSWLVRWWKTMLTSWTVKRRLEPALEPMFSGDISMVKLVLLFTA